jgi:hypothetical protein
MKKQNVTVRVINPQGNDGLTPNVNLKMGPTEKQIQQRAYELHMSRGGHGHALIDWLQAERELNANIEQLQRNHSAALKYHQFIRNKI